MTRLFHNSRRESLRSVHRPGTLNPMVGVRWWQQKRRLMLADKLQTGVAVIVLSSVSAVNAAPLQQATTPADAATKTDIRSPEFAHTVLQTLDDLHRGNSSRARLTMKVVTRHWTRTIGMEAWSSGTKRSMVRITSPKKERGTATLMVDNDLFTYLSKTDRTIKISGAMMGGAWMGSHFTNDDLVRSSRLSDDFTASLTGEGNLQGIDAYQFTLVPRADAAVVWGKIVVTVRQSDLMPIAQVFHDEDGVAVKALTFSDLRTTGDRTLPFKMKMVPLDRPGESTEVTYDAIEFNVPFSDDFFTVQNLRTM